MKVAFLIFILGLNATAFAHNTLWGSPVPVGNGSARSYIEVDHYQRPLALGIAITGTAYEGLPNELHEYNYLLPMPIGYILPPFEHVMLNWNPHGHDPTEIYGAPHFDFHFYTITNETRSNITCAGEDEAICMKTPEADHLPPYYAPTPAGVPEMGWHWFDTRSPEFNGQAFTTTLIYGFYDGQVAFVEPMISREYLMTHPTFRADIPVSTKVAKPGLYPQSYSVRYNSVQDLTNVSVSKFKSY